jgi:hypothetical protein
MTEQTLLTHEEIESALMEIAKASSAQAQMAISELQAARQNLYALYLEEIDNQINTLSTRADTLRAELKTRFEQHAEAGGDTKIHDSITFSRRKTYQYDKKAALQFVIDNDLPYTRTKIELDANAFKKAAQDGTINYIEGEAQNNPVVSIGKLGHMLIPGYTPELK